MSLFIAGAVLAGEETPLMSAEELDALVLDDLQYKYAAVLLCNMPCSFKLVACQSCDKHALCA